MSKRVAVAIKDAGSFNAVWPVILYLMNKYPKWQFTFFATSVAAKRLLYDKKLPTWLAIAFSPKRFDLLISGTSLISTDKDFLEKIITEKALAAGLPVLWVSDVPMSSCRIGNMDINHRAPKFVITAIDEESAKLVRRAREGSTVVVTGHPGRDELLLIDHQAERAKVRHRLGLAEGERFIALMIGYADQSLEVLRALVQALIKLDDPRLVLDPRFHPKILNDPGLAAMKAMMDATLDGYKGKLVNSGDFKRGELLLPAADLVIAPASTVLEAALHYAALHGGPLCLHIILSEFAERLYEEHFCRLAKAPPSIELGAAKLVNEPNPDAIAEQIRLLLWDAEVRESMLANCREFYPLDGLATERVAKEALKLLGI